MFKLFSFVLLAVFCSTCFGQEEFPLSEVSFQGVLGARAGEKTLYCLLGNGFIRTIRSDEETAIVSQWRKQHPDAKAIPVSVADTNSKMPVVYIWAVDGDDNLNLLLIGKGAFPASVMLDAVQFSQLAGLSHLDNAPSKRLVSEARYKDFVQRLVRTETAAQAQKNGIWSEQFNGLRHEEGVMPLNALPPSVLGY